MIGQFLPQWKTKVLKSLLASRKLRFRAYEYSEY